MAYILDIAVILLFVLAILIGIKRGFIKTAVRLVGCILAVVIAFSLGRVIAGWAYDSFLAPVVKEQIVANVPSADTQALKDGIDAALEQLPGFVRNAVDNSIGDPAQIVDALEGELEGNAESIAATVSDKVVRPVAAAMLQMICFFILFIILMIVVIILSCVINKVFKLPVLKQANGVLGGVLGAVEGVLWVLVAVTVIQLVASSAAPDSFISAQNLQDSLLVSKLAEINPITSMFHSLMENLPSMSQ